MTDKRNIEELATAAERLLATTSAERNDPRTWFGRVDALKLAIKVARGEIPHGADLSGGVAQTPKVPDIEAICHDYAQRWFGEDWPLMEDGQKAELRIEANCWLKCWSALAQGSPDHIEIKRLSGLLADAQRIIAEYKASTGARADVAAHGLPGAAPSQPFSQCEQCWQPATCKKKYGCSASAYTSTPQNTAVD